MGVAPNQTPAGGGKVSGGRASRSGTSSGVDVTNEPGNYDNSVIFGGPLPTGTGAPGTAGGHSTASDPTNEPGQVDDGLTGLTESDVTQTGAPGTSTNPNGGAAGTSITYTDPGSYQGGTYRDVTVGDAVSGSQESTQANDEGYATSGPQLPGIKGNEPDAGGSRFQPGGGRVMRGGRGRG